MQEKQDIVDDDLKTEDMGLQPDDEDGGGVPTASLMSKETC